MTPSRFRKTTDLWRHRVPTVLSVLMLGAALYFAVISPTYALIAGGENASDLLGQFTSAVTPTTPDYNTNCPNNLSGFGYSSPQGTAIDTTNHYLYVDDGFNARVVAYALNATNAITAANKVGYGVIGQANMESCVQNTSQNGIGGETSQSCVDPVNGRVFVPDFYERRVTVYNAAGTAGWGGNGENAFFVFGYTDFYDGGGNIAQNDFANPVGCAYDTTTDYLYVADYGDNRVLVFNATPAYMTAHGNGENASFVLGQNSLTATGAATSRSRLNAPLEVALDTGDHYAFVSDSGNNRVMVFNTSALSATGGNALFVLGQPNFTAHTAAITQKGMTTPWGLAYDSTNHRLFVGEQGVPRVTVFNSTGYAGNGLNAVYVLGQPDFVSNNTGNAQNQFGGTSAFHGLAYDATNTLLYVNDSNNNRIMIFSVPTATNLNGENATDLMGHYAAAGSAATNNWNSTSVNNGPNELGLQYGLGAALDPVHHYLFVTDNNNGRIMIYALNADNSFNASTHAASYVLGASDLNDVTSDWDSNSTLNAPGGISVDTVNQRLFVAEDGQSQVKIYDTSGLGTSPGGGAGFNNAEDATIILGGGYSCTRSTLQYDADVAYDAARNYLFVADGVNNRVMVFNVAPGTVANNENAAYVLGQSSFTSCNSATTQTGMNYPMGVAYDSVNQRLFVADGDNNRVLVFNTASLSNGLAATAVIGQTSFTGAGTGSGMNQLQLPDGVAYDPTNSRLFVADCDNGRVLAYNAAPNGFKPLPANNASATVMLGTGSYGLSQSAMILCDTGNNGPINPISYDPSTQRLFIPDKFNNRIMIFDGSYLGSNFFPLLPN